VRLLLDTHALIWWLAGDRQLSAVARGAIGDAANEVLVSAASAWEITTKFRIGKLPEAALLAADVAGAVASQGFSELPISLGHAQAAGSLPGTHRDPFDRVLAAQAVHDKLTLVSNDAIFDGYAVARLW
jgi:PIN domain nuclease of toxin-antitoxin system